jgi:hypothetical protein
VEILNQRDPEPPPRTAHHDGDHVTWVYDVPEPSDRFRVQLNARVEPGVQWRRTGEVQVGAGGADVVTVPIGTWILP